MAYSLNNKLVITVSSRALFNLEAENDIFKGRGIEYYRRYQRLNERKVLKPGAAYPLIKKLLGFNKKLKENVVEAVLVSRNDADSSIRIFNSIKAHGLDISRGAFTNGRTKYEYLSAFSSTLYLSASLSDVRDAIAQKFAAAHVIGQTLDAKAEKTKDDELRIALDFDGVIIDDESEAVYQRNLDLRAFTSYESRLRKKAHNPGPIYKFIQALGKLRRKVIKNKDVKIRTAIFTARNSPAHDRLVTTLRSLEKEGLVIDETFFLGGMVKGPFIEAFGADIFFDDQINHLKTTSNIATAYVPYGIVNKEKSSS